MEVIKDIGLLRQKIKNIGSDSIGLIQVKGIFHEGHIKLIQAARKENFIVIVAKALIQEELSGGVTYDLYLSESEVELASRAGADFFFYPSKESLHSGMAITKIQFKSPLATSLNGSYRPHYYENRINTTCILLNMTGASRIYLSDKDLQLVILTRKMLEDFHYNCELVVLPRLRDRDGLILSVQNQCMPEDVRSQVACLYPILEKAQVAVQKGMISCRKLKWHIENEFGKFYLCPVEWIEIVEPHDLKRIETITDEAIIIVTLKLGQIRLSDYIKIKLEKK